MAKVESASVTEYDPKEPNGTRLAHRAPVTDKIVPGQKWHDFQVYIMWGLSAGAYAVVYNNEKTARIDALRPADSLPD